MATILKEHKSSGEIRYRVMIRRKGVRTMTRRFRTRTHAQRWARQVEAQIDAGRDLPSSRDRERTVATLLREYETEIVPRYTPSEQRSRRKVIRWWQDRIGTVRLVHLHRSQVESLLRGLSRGDSISGKKLAPHGRNKYLGVLRHAINIAVKRWEWLPHNPLLGMNIPEPKGRQRYLGQRDPGELDRLLEACRELPNRRLYTLVLCALSSGGRRAEILNLHRHDIDLEAGVGVVHRSKNDEPKLLHFAGPALEALRALMLDHSGQEYPFASPGYPRPCFPWRQWVNVLEAAGIEDFRFHDLRHTAGSWAAMSGATDREIGELLGHKTARMARRYSHLRREHTQGVARRLVDAFLVPVEETSRLSRS